MGRGGGALPKAARSGPVERGGVTASAAIESGVPLARMTTVGIGGPARALARPRTSEELKDVLAWAAQEGLEARPIGLGSNVLAADAGVDALVIRLEGDLAAVDVQGDRLVAGGGAANAVCLHRARAVGLGGFEFACAIPGTAGGGVRMNAGAYGGDWRAILDRALVVDADGFRWLSATELELSYRHSALVPGQVVAKVEFGLTPRPAAEIRATIAALQVQRKGTQPTNKRTFGSVFKNPNHELGAGRMIEQCGLKGHRIGGALFSPRHANFIENAGGATARDALALMAEARRRALDHFGVVLEREVELVGEIELPEAGALPN
jgi:UDP-N-acetylenolpyruvoylglucosamine reductase